MYNLLLEIRSLFLHLYMCSVYVCEHAYNLQALALVNKVSLSKCNFDKFIDQTVNGV